MTSATGDYKRQRGQLAHYLATHRETILNRWPMSSASDNTLQERTLFSREELADPLPALLTFFTQGITGELQESDLVERACSHWIHRWQYGYPLMDLLTEIDNFYENLDTEIQYFLESYPQTPPNVIAQAYTQLRQLVKIVSKGVSLSVDRLRQMEADEQVKKLQAALNRLHQDAHTMRSHLGIISVAASLLQNRLTEDDQVKYQDMIIRNVSAVNHLFNQILVDDQAE